MQKVLLGLFRIYSYSFDRGCNVQWTIVEKFLFAFHSYFLYNSCSHCIRIFKVRGMQISVKKDGLRNVLHRFLCFPSFIWTILDLALIHHGNTIEWTVSVVTMCYHIINWLVFLILRFNLILSLWLTECFYTAITEHFIIQ